MAINVKKTFRIEYLENRNQLFKNFFFNLLVCVGTLRKTVKFAGYLENLLKNSKNFFKIPKKCHFS